MGLGPIQGGRGIRQLAKSLIEHALAAYDPAEIESLLITMPGLRDCAVFGIPDPEFGEQLVAAIELMPGIKIQEAEVRSFVSNKLAGFKVPKIVKFYGKLPREDSGKIFKRLLRENFALH